jgi:hypothetical protein
LYSAYIPSSAYTKDATFIRQTRPNIFLGKPHRYL